MFRDRVRNRNVDIHTVRRKVRSMISTIDASQKFLLPDDYKFINAGGNVKLKKLTKEERSTRAQAIVEQPSPFRTDNPTFYMETILAEQTGGDVPAASTDAGKIFTLSDSQDQSTSIDTYFDEHKSAIEDKLLQEWQIRGRRPVKVQFAVEVKYTKSLQTDEEVLETSGDRQHNTDFFVINSAADIKQKVSEAKRILQLISETATHQGSGYQIAGINALGLTLIDFETNSGASYIPLPAHLAAKKACINIKNDDECCFEYCILLHRHGINKNAQRSDQYDSLKGILDFSRCKLPMSDARLDLFEVQNNIAINLYKLNDQDEVKLLRLSSNLSDDIVNLLLIQSSTGKQHYVYIKNLNRLFSDGKHHKHVCPRCLHAFSRKEALMNHLDADSGGCRQQARCHLRLPACHSDADRNQIRFRKFHHKYHVECFIVADVQCLLTEDMSQKHSGSQIHHPFATAYRLMFKTGQHMGHSFLNSDPEKTMVQLLMRLQADARLAKSQIQRFRDLDMSLEQQRLYAASTHCHICGKSFLSAAEKVRDHDHATGRFRGAAHSSCNLEYNNRWLRIPVFFHNLAGYAAHFIILAAKSVSGRFRIVPRTSEKFIALSWSWGEGITLDFRDSKGFLDAPIDTLFSDLETDVGTQFLKEKLENVSPRMCNLEMLAEMTLPVDYLSASTLEDRQFPSRDAWKSRLHKSCITQDAYESNRKLWHWSGCVCLRDFVQLYLIRNVAMLMCILQAFKTACVKEYRLDPMWYVTAPSLFWDSALLSSNCPLDVLVSGQEEIQATLKKGLRGGFCGSLELRHAKANNPLTTYDPHKPTSWLMSFDVNSLYPSVMKELLPIGDYSLLENPAEFDIFGIDIDGEFGYIVECDLDYPGELHAAHNAFPLAVDYLNIGPETLSPYTKSLAEATHQELRNTTKLTANFLPKKNYVVHLRTLRFYLAHGMKLTTIHRVITFRQGVWLKKYVSASIQRRKAAHSAFSERLHKLSANVIYGKFLEDPSHRYQFRLLKSSTTSLHKHAAKHTLRRVHRFSDEMVGIQIQPRRALLRKPHAVGVAILDLAKLAMYKLHYDHFMPYYGPQRLQLCYTDTDSLIYHILTQDIYEDMKSYKHLLDLSNYPQHHSLFESASAKEPGLLKDEMGGEPIAEIVCLRPKLYAISCQSWCKKRAKGISRGAMGDIAIDDYGHCLSSSNGNSTKYVTMTVVQSASHQVQTRCVQKLALSSLDDKRYHLNATQSLAFGHKMIQASEINQP